MRSASIFSINLSPIVFIPIYNNNNLGKVFTYDDTFFLILYVIHHWRLNLMQIKPTVITFALLVLCYVDFNFYDRPIYNVLLDETKSCFHPLHNTHRRLISKTM